MRFEEAFFNELEKISKLIQKKFDFKEEKVVPKADPFKKPKKVHLGTMYKENPEGMKAFANAIRRGIEKAKKK